MDMLKELLSEIESIYMEPLSNDVKYNKVSTLWEKYYKLKNKYNISSADEYNLNLLAENACYKINQEPSMTIPDMNIVKKSLLSLNEAIKNSSGIEESEAECLLNYVIYHTRKQLSILGIDILTCSMNGFCELAQILSLKAFEEIGLNVTKNLAENDFMYSLHHCYGTVTFPIKSSSKVYNKSYLIDVTYRQFFTSNRCHRGMYYIKDCDSDTNMYPDPGYFVDDVDFAKILLKEGYIELNNETAKQYGMPFTLSSIHSDMADNINYLGVILNSKDDYYLSNSDLEGLEVSFKNIDLDKKVK